MFSSLYKQQDYFMKGSQKKADFRMFRDYLGLANLVAPGGIKIDASAEDECCRQRQGEYLSMEMDIDYELEARVIRPRKRMNSIESDARSETSSSSRSSDSDASYESLASLSSGSEVFVPAPAFPSLPAQSPIGEALHPFLQPQQQQVRPIQMPPARPCATKNANKVSVCVFCRNNGESREFYSSHTLKDAEGNTTCPILRAYTCPLCKANGDQSHTIKYCPKYTPKTGQSQIGHPSQPMQRV